MKKDNLNSVLIKFLKFLKVPISFQSIIVELQIHPHSLRLAVDNVLNTWRIPNASYNIPFEGIAEFPLMFFGLCCRGDTADFLMVMDIDE